MPRFIQERYDIGDDYALTRPFLPPVEIREIQEEIISSEVASSAYPQITADQNNYALQNLKIHRFTTDAARTITGFVNVSVDLNVILNAGTQNLVLANDSASSDTTNRILTHTGANITLAANESIEIFYDNVSNRVRTVGN